MRRHLTNSERAIRGSRGIPIWRLIPFALPIIAIFIMSSDDQIFLQCVGKAPEFTSASGAKYVAFVRVLISIPCSPYYIRDFAQHWLVIALFLVGIALAIPQILWMRQHKAYWDTVREKEKLKRAEKAAAKVDDKSA